MNWLALLACGALLAGCATDLRSLDDLAHLDRIDMRGPFNPRYRYLRVTANGRAVPMVLGFIDPPARPGGAPTDVWYSAAHEVLRLRDGMVVGSAGLPVNWVDVRYTGWPAWGERPQTIERVRDVEPGYRFGLHDTLRIVAIAPSHSSELRGVAPDSLRWFEVTNLRNHHRMLYAVRGKLHPRVVYGEQCLDPSLCLTWQDWPPRPAAAAKG